MENLIQKNTITREYLARHIKKETGIGVVKSTKIVDDFFDIISNFIMTYKEVKIRLFGTFSVKQKSERIGRNPKTLDEVVIPPRTVVKFKVAPTLKSRINLNLQNFKHFFFNDNR